MTRIAALALITGTLRGTTMAQQVAEFSSYYSGNRYDFRLTQQQLLNTPAWLDDEPNPPLSPRTAQSAALSYLRSIKLSLDTRGEKHLYQRWYCIYTILLLLFAVALFSDVARCQTESYQVLPPLPSPVEPTLQIPVGGSFISLLPGTFEGEARGEDSAKQEATGSSPEPQNQTQESDRQGLVMRSVRRTLKDQKELYRAPFKPSNLKWDALVLGGTAALLAADRDIEKHIGHAHYTFYQTTSDVAIAGLGATLGGVWIWGIKGDHPHAKETGVLELETLVNTFLIYTPMQLLAARERPDEGNGNGDFWKHHNINTSFPGGHAMFTFAMATVVSHEYPQKWVQALAYSAATIVTVTRFMARDHWSSDMFAGAALGIGIGAHIFHAHCDPQLSDSCKHHVRWIF